MWMLTSNDDNQQIIAGVSCLAEASAKIRKRPE
jgi:hypothetical protein